MQVLESDGNRLRQLGCPWAGRVAKEDIGDCIEAGLRGEWALAEPGLWLAHLFGLTSPCSGAGPCTRPFRPSGQPSSGRYDYSAVGVP